MNTRISARSLCFIYETWASASSFSIENIPDKKDTHHVKNCSTLRKITSDRPVSFMYVRYCCITHPIQAGVKHVLKKIIHEPSGGQIVKSQKRRFYNSLLLD